MSTISENRSDDVAPPAAFGPLVATGDGVVLPGGERVLAGREITALTRESDGDALWALVDRTEVHRVGDDGGAEPVARLDEGAGTCLHVHGGTVWVGGDEAALWRLADGRLERVTTFDDAPTHDEWHTPWGGPPSVMSMASHGDDLYVSVHVGGVLRTSDGGRTWVPTIDLQDDVHQVTVDADGTLWAATGYSGLATSSDRGGTWSYHTDGLHGTYLLTVATTSAGVLVGASSNHSARDGAVYLYDAGGFTRIESGLPGDLDGAIRPRQLAASGSVAALVTPQGGVHTSDDGGAHWSHVLDIEGRSADVVVAPRPPA